MEVSLHVELAHHLISFLFPFCFRQSQEVDLGVFLVLGITKSMYVSCLKGWREKLFLTSLLGLSVQSFTQEVTWKGL